jgi:hypothetical protein
MVAMQAIDRGRTGCAGCGHPAPCGCPYGGKCCEDCALPDCALDEVELYGTARARPSVGKVMTILVGMLVGGPRPLPEIRQAVEGVGFGERTLYAAKDALGIVGRTFREGGRPTCLWVLPPRSIEPPAEDEPIRLRPVAPVRTGRILKAGDSCPRCGARLIREGGGLYCLNCGGL